MKDCISAYTLTVKSVIASGDDDIDVPGMTRVRRTYVQDRADGERLESVGPVHGGRGVSQWPLQAGCLATCCQR